MFSCSLPFQWHLHISVVSKAFRADLEASPFLTMKWCGRTQWGVENTLVKSEHLSQQRVKFLIILFVWSWLGGVAENTLHVNIFFMYSEHKDSSVLPYWFIRFSDILVVVVMLYLWDECWIPSLCYPHLFYILLWPVVHRFTVKALLQLLALGGGEGK